MGLGHPVTPESKKVLKNRTERMLQGQRSQQGRLQLTEHGTMWAPETMTDGKPLGEKQEFLGSYQDLIN